MVRTCGFGGDRMSDRKVLKFNAWSQDKLRRNLKTCTTRMGRTPLAGTRFTVNVGTKGQADYRTYEVTKRRYITLSTVTKAWWKKEGADSPEDFVKRWRKIYPKVGYDPNQRVWLCVFVEVEIYV